MVSEYDGVCENVVGRGDAVANIVKCLINISCGHVVKCFSLIL